MAASSTSESSGVKGSNGTSDKMLAVIDQKEKILYRRCGAYSRAALISIFDHLDASNGYSRAALNRIITVLAVTSPRENDVFGSKLL